MDLAQPSDLPILQEERHVADRLSLAMALGSVSFQML